MFNIDNIKNNKKIWIVVLLVLAIGLFVILSFIQKGNKTNTPPVKEVEGMILFYGDGCSHCATLDEWIKNNGVEGKVEFSKLEVFNNKENQDLLINKASVCGIQADGIGVPFFWDGKTCIVGDELIEKFFEEKINLNTNITNETTK